MGLGEPSSVLDGNAKSNEFWIPATVIPIGQFEIERSFSFLFAWDFAPEMWQDFGFATSIGRTVRCSLQERHVVK